MRLNPFVYIPETDALFYLLVTLCLVIPALWIQSIGYVIIFVAFEDIVLTASLSLALFTFTLFFIPVLIYFIYKRSPRRIATKSQAKILQEDKFPEQYQNIKKLYMEYPHVFDEPTLMYNLDSDLSAFTFGAGKKLNIQMSTGLLLTDETETFNAIVLHEMGHLENNDVRKAGFAVSATSVMKYLLPAILAVWVINDAYYKIGMLYYGTLAGYDLSYILEEMQLGRSFLWVGVYVLVFLAIGLIIIAIRNQIVRVREFYADARALEWAKSSTSLISALLKHENLNSRFESYRKFHPRSEERIQVLKDNIRLFIPSLWIVFSAGLVYSYLVSRSSDLWGIMLISQGLFEAISSSTLITMLATILFFGVLMLVISSEFHKYILSETLIKTRYLSPTAFLNIVKVAIVFSLGINFGLIIANIESIGGYFTDFGDWVVGVLNIFSAAWLFQAFRFLIVLLFLWFLGSLLVRRSFSRKDARRNFFLTTFLTSVLYPLINPTIAQIIFNNNTVWILSVLVFSGISYIFVKIIDRNLQCPHCNSKLKLSGLSFTCPNCKGQLYSWAIYF